MDFILKLFDTTGFMPHGHCYLWTPTLVYMNVVSDGLIFAAYLAISITLILLITKVREIPFQPIYAAFGLFIVACGVTHLMEIFNVWIPTYWAAASIKVVTAVASVGTAFLLPFYFPKARDLARGALLNKTQEALRKSEALYRQIVDTANEGIWVLDLDNRSKFVNRRMAEILGYTVEEMIGCSLSDYMEDEEIQKVNESRANKIGSSVENHVFKMRHKNGSDVWARVACNPIYDANGKVSSALGMVTDITKKRQAEEQLRLSEIHYRSLVEAIPQLVWSHFVDGQADYSNPNLVEQLGFVPRDVIQEMLEVIHPDERELTRKLWEDAFREEQAIECEYRLLRQDGVYRWQLSRIIPLRDEEGRLIKWMGIATDIHEQKEDRRIIYESQLKLKAALQNMNAVLFVVDRDYSLTTCEGRNVDLAEFGDGSVGGSPFDLSYGMAERNEALREAFEGKSATYEFVTGDVARETRVNPLIDEEGEICGVVGVSIDITERKKAEKATRDTQERLRVMSEAVPQMIWTSNPDGTPTYYNQRWVDYSGLDLEHCASKGWDTVVHDDDLKEVKQAWVHSIGSGCDFQAQYRIKRALDGEFRWHLARALPVRNEKGAIVQWFGTVTDIHDQKITEEITRNLERKLTTLLNNAPIILWSTDLDGTITLSQGKALQKLGRESGELLGMKIFEFASQAAVTKDMSRIRSGESFTTVSNYGGSWFETHHSPTRDAEGRIVGQVAVSTDITEKRVAEIAQDQHRIREASAQEASRLKSEFLAHMSHEIRTPLNGLIGMVNLISETALNAEQRDYAENALRSGEILMTVVNDVLDLSKIEAGKLDIEIISFDLYELLKDIEKDLFYTSRSKGLRLYAEIDSDIPRYIKSDPGRVRQILTNLMSNAIKFTEHGSIHLRAQKILTHGSAFLRFEVIDTGIGISKDGLNKLFNAFAQADSSTTRRFGGTGLGLSISKHLVERMDGLIGADSTEGVGSRFWFTIALKEGEAAAPSIQVQVGARSVKDVNILIADDNLINRKVILKFLDSLGYRAQAVSNGLDVLKALDEQAYHLILMDCHMPEMDGYECTRTIRRSDAMYRSIPIVALTASAMKKDYDRAFESGMNAYIAKPLKKDILDEVLQDLLSATRNAQAESEFALKRSIPSLESF